MSIRAFHPMPRRPVTSVSRKPVILSLLVATMLVNILPNAVCAADPVGGIVNGLRLGGALCRNMTTGQTVLALPDGASWDCEAAGLSVRQDDHITMVQMGIRPLRQRANLVANDGALFDHLGLGVTILGEAAIIGAPDDDDRGLDSGSAYVYSFDGMSWSQTQKLVPSDGIAGDKFGSETLLHTADTGITGSDLRNSLNSLNIRINLSRIRCLEAAF